jgi:hypothetical protein
VEFIGLGHAPHIEAPTTFFNALLAWLPWKFGGEPSIFGIFVYIWVGFRM